MSNAALDFANEDSFAVATQEKPKTMAAVEFEAIADDVTLAECENQLKSLADVGATALMEAEKIGVIGEGTAQVATETATKLKKIAKDIDEARLKSTKPFRDFVDKVNAIGNRLSSPFSAAAEILGKKVIAWKKAEDARIAADLKAKQKAKEEALLAGKKPEPVATYYPPVSAPIKIPVRVTYTYEITDFNLVPDEWKKVVIDDEKLGKAVSSQAVTAVPGVKIIKNETLVGRR